MSWMIAWRLLLFCGAVVITGWLVYEYDVIAVLFRSLWNWILTGWRWFIAFMQRTAVRIGIRRALRPLWIALGLVWLGTFFKKLYRRTVGKRVAAWVRLSKRRWRNAPWWIKASLAVVLIALMLVFGVGLWLVPFGVPFVGTAVRKVRVWWIDSWLERRMRNMRKRFRLFVRRYRDRWWARTYRGMRYYRLRRDRRWRARAKEIIRRHRDRIPFASRAAL